MKENKTENTKGKRIYARLSDEEFRIFEERKKKYRVENNSDFIRACVLGNTVRTTVVDLEKKKITAKLSIIRSELNMIGNNINQITKIIHAEQKKGALANQAFQLPKHLNDLSEQLEKQKTVISNITKFIK
jgi:vacuolar-type H+-ATPase subunit I/STV1